MFFDITITNRDNCISYPLKRLGLGGLINWEDDTPSIPDLCKSEMFDHVESPEVGCLLIWLHKNKDATDGYYMPHRILESGKVVSVKRYSYGHCALYEYEDMVSDLAIEDSMGLVLRVRAYADLPKPDYILKYRG